MVHVPAGPFVMGADSGATNQQPVRTVALDSFLIDVYEVTNARFADFLNSEGPEDPTGTPYINLAGRVVRVVETDGRFEPASLSDSGTPVVHVTWVGAQAYCTWASMRLPSEAEWEKSARGTDGRLYPWGNEAPTGGFLNYNKNVGMPTEIGSYPRGVSPYGALDMAGNVFEWVADYYQSDYYTSAPTDNPTGPESGTFRVFRGGSHPALVDAWVQATYRQPASEVSGLVDVGFRCARNP
jgi:formylglycine-generating enzyme required for sulfatase activity